MGKKLIIKNANFTENSIGAGKTTSYTRDQLLTSVGNFKKIVSSGTWEFDTITNWAHTVIPLQDVISIRAQLTASWTSQEQYDIPPIVYLSSNIPSNDSVIGIQHANTPISGYAIGKFDGYITIPSNATHVLLQTAKSYSSENDTIIIETALI